jgi:hypothetical protein
MVAGAAMEEASTPLWPELRSVAQVALVGTVGNR